MGATNVMGRPASGHVGEAKAGNATEAPKPDSTEASAAPVFPALMLSADQACRLLGIGRTTLWGLVGDGAIGSVKTGSRLQFPLPIVEEYVARQAERAREQDARRQRFGARTARR